MLAVANDKYVSGIDDLTQSGLAFHWLPFEQAITNGWPTDAHFVTYFPVNSGSSTFPRFKKPLLPKMRHHGADIMTQMLAFDYDNAGHGPWTPDLLSGFWWLLSQVVAQWPMADAWHVLYTTKAGARLIYVLDEPIPVDIAEGKHRWMVQQFKQCGLIVDPLSDWTRFFRLPYVVRDGRPTWATQTITYIPRYGNRIRAEDLPTLDVGMTNDYAPIREFREAKPMEDDCDLVLHSVNSATGRKSQSEWVKAARAKLKGRDCFACLFEHQPLAQPGSRDQTLHQYVGQATSLLYNIPGTTPTHIYALFLEPVKQFEPDQQTRDWTDTLWGHVGRLWVKEEAKAKAQEVTAAKTAEGALGTLDAIVNGMREWCDDKRLQQDAHTAREFAAQHMLCSVDGRYFVMKQDGWYDEMQLVMPEIIPRIRGLGMDNIIEVKVVNDSGLGFKYLDAKSVIDRHATVAASIRGTPQIKGGWIENMDHGSATLVVPSFCRNPHLVPEFDHDVDLWLQRLFMDRFLDGCEWIAWALAFEEGPICALSLKSGAGGGKKLIARGLAETLLRPKLATAEDLVSSNQYALLQSPFVHIDEGWPMGASRQRHPSDQFRALVSGQSFECNRKFKAPVEVSNPVRVLMTANNTNVVQMLTAGRELSPEDREALAVRLKHMDVGDTSAMWLRQKGGLAFTGRKGHRWIMGDGGEPSDYVVAKHFLWLYQNREKPIPKSHHSGRFLVEGDADSEIMFEMRTNTGSTPLVIEALIRMINLPNQQECLVIQDHRMFVTTAAVLDFFRDHMQTRERLTAQVIANVFKGLISMDHPNPMTLRDRPQLSKRRWYELDPELLMGFARRFGWTCRKLDELVQARAVVFSTPPGV